jgi:cytochrome P450
MREEEEAEQLSAENEGKTVTLEELDVNPYPAYKRLQATGTVVWVEAVNRWMVTRWDDVIHVDTNDEIFSAMETGSLQTRVMGRTMLRMDGAAHDRRRKAAEEPFRPKTVRQRWHEMLGQAANDIIDGFADRGECELVDEFAGPFAARALKTIMGLHTATDEDMQRWTRDLMDGTSNYADDPDVWARSERSAREIDEAVKENIARVKDEPDGSALSAQVHADVHPSLSFEEICSDQKLMIGGGINEPRDAIGIAMWGLLMHPEQLAMVREDPSLFKFAAEEAVRWISPLAMYPREVAVDTEISGTELKQGSRLAVCVGAANRDPGHWKDPDRFDITRGKVKNLAFGMGPHFCLGTWVARQQLGPTTLPLLFERLPNLRLNLDYPPEFKGWVFRGPTHLHLEWTRDRHRQSAVASETGSERKGYGAARLRGEGF